jgi:hypothetical protein
VANFVLSNFIASVIPGEETDGAPNSIPILSPWASVSSETQAL